MNPSLRLQTTSFAILAATAMLMPSIQANDAERHLLYVATPGIRNYLEFGGAGILVFDMDRGHSFVKRIETTASRQAKPENIKGVCACAATGKLYFSTLSRLYCVDLQTEKTVWEKALPGGCDRMAMSPDGKVLYVPSLEGPHWNIVDGATGDLISQVVTKSASHNTVGSLDGSRVYLAGLKSPFLSVLDTKTKTVIEQVGPFSASIRPFTINAARTRCYVNVNELLGFEIGDLTTGKILHRVEVQGFHRGPIKRHSCPSHGVGLTPDEKEVWVVDAANQHVHIFDNTVSPPKQIAGIPLREQPGWVTFSLDGRYAYPSTGEVIDAKTKKILTVLKDEEGREVHSEKMVEVVMKGDSIVRTGDQFGVGRAVASADTKTKRANPNNAGAKEAKPNKFWVYVGTYTGKNSKGIYRVNLDLTTGKLDDAELAIETKNPSFLAIHPNRRFLYAVGEVDEMGGKKTGGVNAFTIDPQSGALKQLSQQPSLGAGPCHLVLDKEGKFAMAANYGGGSAVVLPIESDGRLSPFSAFVQHKGSSVNKQRQEGPHAHSINIDPANRFAFVADLGLDKVMIYRFDSQRGTLTPADSVGTSVAAGAGPRHFAFNPDGRHAYVINEMSNTMTAFDFNPENGSLKEIQTITTLPTDFRGTSYCAEVVVHPSGKFVYGSNRGHDSIAIFQVDEKTGKLSAAGHLTDKIKTPRNFAIDPTGTYLLVASQDADTVASYKIDPSTGALKPTGSVVKVPFPVCLRMMPALIK